MKNLLNWIYLSLLLLSIFLLWKMNKEGYRGRRGGRLGRGPYGNPIGGGFVGSRWYRAYPYLYSTYPYPTPYYGGGYWYPPGYAGCPLTSGCLASPYVYP